MNFAISNNYSPNFMAKKSSGVSKRIGDGFKHFKETAPEEYRQFMVAINEKNALKLPKSKNSVVDFYRNQGFKNVPHEDLLLLPKSKNSAVDFYKNQGFKNVPHNDLVFVPKSK